MIGITEVVMLSIFALEFMGILFIIGKILQLRRENKPKPQTRIYCGSEDYVDFFKTIVSTLGISVDYEVVEVDGEYEIVVGGKQ